MRPRYNKQVADRPAAEAAGVCRAGVGRMVRTTALWDKDSALRGHPGASVRAIRRLQRLAGPQLAQRALEPRTQHAGPERLTLCEEAPSQEDDSRYRRPSFLAFKRGPDGHAGFPGFCTACRAWLLAGLGWLTGACRSAPWLPGPAFHPHLMLSNNPSGASGLLRSTRSEPPGRMHDRPSASALLLATRRRWLECVSQGAARDDRGSASLLGPSSPSAGDPQSALGAWTDTPARTQPPCDAAIYHGHCSLRSHSFCLSSV